MEIRKTRIDELDKVMDIYARARKFMAEHDNPTQWGINKPSREQIKEDILAGKCHVCVEGDELAAVFYFAHETDPTYTKIYEGQWLNDEDYSVVHRIASAGTVKGAGSFCMNWACAQSKNVKIDTHKDNEPMRRSLIKNGFDYCGIIYLTDGNRRVAYEKLLD